MAYPDFFIRLTDQAEGNKALYSHKIIKEQYHELREALVKNWGHQSRYFCMAFVLYACEWWKREYTGGHWAWQGIFDALGKSISNTQERNEVVRRGFQYWGRPIPKNGKGNDYLGAVVIESGIPVGVLTEGHYLTSIITRTYQNLKNVSSSNANLKEFVDTSRLPNTLDNAAFKQLLVDFAYKLHEVVTQYSLHKHSNPVESLDEQAPDWRDKFPIRVVDSDTAKTFIDGLVSETTEIERKIKEKPAVRISYMLKPHHEEQWTVKPMIHEIKGEFMPYQLGLTEQEIQPLSSKLQLVLEANGQEKSLGYLFKSGDSLRGNIGATHIASNAFEFEARISLWDEKKGRRIDIGVEIEKLELEGPPHIFIQGEKHWTLLASGSIRATQNRCRVLFPHSISLSCSQYKELATAVTSMRLAELFESATLTHEEGHYSIELGVQHGDINAYQLGTGSHAKPFPLFPSRNPNTFIGIPIAQNKNGRISREQSKLEYKTLTMDWEVLPSAIAGKVRVRNTTGGNQINLLKTIQVLPPDLTFEYSRHRITLRTQTALDLSVITEVESELTPIQGGCEIRFSSGHSSVLESFELAIKSNGAPNPAKLTLPFPHDGAIFCDKEGRVLRQMGRLSRNQLLGARLWLFNANSSRDRTFSVEIKLDDHKEGNRISLVRFLRVPGNQNKDIPLILLQGSINQCFSGVTNINAPVTLECEGKRISVTQFDGGISIIDGVFKVSRLDTTQDDGNYEIACFPLDKSFDKDAVKPLLPTDEEGVYPFPEGNGKWLVYTTKDSKLQCRPIAYDSHNGAADTGELMPNLELYQTSYYTNDIRIEAIRSVARKMANDYSHPDWERVNALTMEILHLPMTTYDFWKVAMKDQEVMVGCVFKCAPDIIQKLREETSTILHQIRMGHWIAGFKRFCETCSMPSSEMQDLVIERSIANISESIELPILGEMLRLQWKQEKAPALPLQVLQPFISSELFGQHEKPGLKGRHDADHWPTVSQHTWDSMLYLFQALPDEIKQILPHYREIQRHQQPTIYLPFVLSALAFLPDFPETIITSVQGAEMKALIDFDEDWFNTCYHYLASYYLSNPKA